MQYPLIVVWPYAAVFWPAMAWAYAPELRLNLRARSLAGTQDAGSLRLMVVFQVAALWMSFAIAFVDRFGSLSRQRLWFWVGLGMMILGSLLRRHCFRMLGSSFTAVVVVLPGQTIVERGAYQWVRHPSYTAALLFLGGVAIALANWASIVVVWITVALTYIYRVRIEERALVATLGEPYRAYMRRTKRFLPLIV